MLLYIDPGTGSMLFTVLIGIVGTVMYSIRLLTVKIKYKVSGGKVDSNKDKIPMVIFAEDKKYWHIFKPICNELEKQEKEVVYMTMSEDDKVFEQDYIYIKPQYIGQGNKAYAKLNLLNATIVLSTTPGLDVYQWKRSKNVDYYIHIPHAPNDILRYRMFGLDYYDAVLLSGQYQIDDIRQIEELRNLPAKDMRLVGVPYLDEMLKRKREEKSEYNAETTVLLAPTWGKSSIFALYGDRILQALVDTGYRLIIRPHPQSFVSDEELINNLIKRFPESDKLEWNRDLDNFDVLNRSDIIIADYSGVIFDYAFIFDRPVIFTNPEVDLGVYDIWWLNKPLWTSSALYNIGQELTEDKIDDIKNVIDECMSKETYKKGREQAKTETWTHIGEGAERIVEYMLEKYEEIACGEEEKEDKNEKDNNDEKEGEE